MDTSIEKALQMTKKAYEAVQQAQENPAYFQEAQKQLLIAEDSMHEILTNDTTPTIKEQQEINRMKDLLRLTEETQQVNRMT
ncbi:hypothetical protein RZN22_10885 [Bacillaceae bacterium S4-13-58]